MARQCLRLPDDEGQPPVGPCRGIGDEALLHTLGVPLMPIKFEFGGINLTGDTQREPSEARRANSSSVRIGVIGDFRGRGGRGPVESGRALSARRLLRIDRDNFDSILGRLGVELVLNLPAAGPTPTDLTFREFDDFHPDQIVARAEVFGALRTTRERLLDPMTFAETAAEIGRTTRPAAPSAPTPPPPAPNVPPEALLDLILQQSTPSVESSPPAPVQTGAFGAFLDQITAPHTRREEPLQTDLVAGVEDAMAQVLREILHHPDFQALESLWRAVYVLTRRLDTGSDLTIELIDLTRAELEDDLVSTTSIESTATYKLLVEPTLGTEGSRPWTFLIGDFTFGPSRRDVALLWRLGGIARLAGAPFLAAASSRWVGCDSLASASDPDDWGSLPDEEGWSDLRQSAEAPYLGLALPRFLLRAPYAPESNSIETFTFAEFPESPAHELYLWGNPAFALSLLVASSFDDSGHFEPEYFDVNLADLPIALETSKEGETRAKPCAEVLLGRRAVDRIIDAGLMPLQSVRDQGVVRLAKLVSIAESAVPLRLP
jgi:type VI secretion system protein ImpC